MASPRTRWTILLSAFALTAGAIVYPVDEQVSANNLPARTPTRPPSATPTATSPVMAEQPRLHWIASDENPFEPRGWVALPPPPPPQQQVVEAALVPDTPLPPPPLPFKFLGQMSDGGDRIIYLKMGEQVVLARQGDMLEGGYKVVAVTANQIEFESANSGTHQTLSIPVQDN